MPTELILALGLLAVFLAITILLATIGAITSERQAVNRSLAAVQAIQTSPTSMQAELETWEARHARLGRGPHCACLGGAHGPSRIPTLCRSRW